MFSSLSKRLDYTFRWLELLPADLDSVVIVILYIRAAILEQMLTAELIAAWCTRHCIG